MKSRFFLSLVSACIAFAIVCLSSCVKADIPEPDNGSSTRADVEIKPPVGPPIGPSMDMFYCASSNRSISGSQLFTNTKYTFSLFYVESDEYLITMTVYDSDGNRVSGRAVIGNGSVSMTFTKIGKYTVKGSVMYLDPDTPTKNYEKTYDVVNEGPDVATATLKVPFNLYVNTHKYNADTDVSIAVEETAFNDPQYTLEKIRTGVYKICINEPGAYKFKGTFTNLPDLANLAAIHPVFCVEVFYTPGRLECVSTYESGGVYSNVLRLPQIKVGQYYRYQFLEYRWCANYSKGDEKPLLFGHFDLETGSKVIKPFGLYAPADAIDINMPDTKGSMLGNVNIVGNGLQLSYNNIWNIYYPRDTCYMYDAAVTISPGKGSELERELANN